MKTDVIQKAIVKDAEGRILVLRRSGTDTRRPHQCDLPGGELEDGEELIEGVRREIREETGLEVTDIRPVFSKTGISTWNDAEGRHTTNVVRIIYVTRAVSSDVRISNEHEEFKWLPIEDAVNEYDYPLHKEILNYVIENQLLD